MESAQAERAEVFHFGKLANAYHAWAPVGTSVLVEFYNQRGEKFGEYADGVFTMGAPFNTPRECDAGEIGCPVATARAGPPAASQASAQASAPELAGAPPQPQASPSQTTAGSRSQAELARQADSVRAVYADSVARLNSTNAGERGSATGSQRPELAPALDPAAAVQEWGLKAGRDEMTGHAFTGASLLSEIIEGQHGPAAAIIKLTCQENQIQAIIVGTEPPGRKIHKRVGLLKVDFSSLNYIDAAGERRSAKGLRSPG